MSLSRSETKRIAARYVAAMMDIAQREGAQEAVGQDLEQLAATLATSAELRRVVVGPMIPAQAKRAAFDALLVRLSAQEVTRRLIAFIIERKRIALLPQIAESYRHALIEARNEREAEIVTAAEANPAQRSAIERALAQATGRAVRLTYRVDPSILGGVTIKMGSLLLDRSVSGRLARLENKLRADAAAS